MRDAKAAATKMALRTKINRLGSLIGGLSDEEKDQFAKLCYPPPIMPPIVTPERAAIMLKQWIGESRPELVLLLAQCAQIGLYVVAAEGNK